MSSPLPDYYKVLNIPSTATPEQIKTSYKRASLLCHPDRVPLSPTGDRNGENEKRRQKATQQFQQVADAYYTLSDPARRAAYDRLLSSSSRSHSSSSFPSSSSAGGAGESFFDFFASRAGAPHSKSHSHDAEEEEEGEEEYGRPDPEHVFGSVFEDLLRPEVNRVMPLWWGVGAVAGAALGFIAGNLPGAAIGAFGGSKLGAVRDAKGKAVYTVFQELGANQKAEILKGLAAKVFGMSGIGQTS